MDDYAHRMAGPTPQSVRRSLVAGIAVCTLCALLFHVALCSIMERWSIQLGAISDKVAPFYAYWRPHVKGWLVLPIAAAAVHIGRMRKSRAAAGYRNRWAVAYFLVMGMTIAISTAMVDGGIRAVAAPLTRTDLEYSGAIDDVRDPIEFLRSYPTLMNSLPMHAQVHPPGAILLLWSVSQVTGSSPAVLAFSMIALASLSVAIVFWWANQIYGPGSARRAAALFILTPSVVLFTATSMDGPFTLFLVATMACYWAGLNERPWLWGSLAGAACWLASTMTYSVSIALLFCGLSTILVGWPARRPGDLVRCGTNAIVASLVFLSLNFLTWLVSGFDPIETLRVAVANHHSIMNGGGHDSVIRYLLLVPANLVAFLVACGIPVLVLLAFAVRRLPGNEPDRSRTFLLTSLLCLGISALLPIYTLEVERIWMFLVPLVILPAARQLFELERWTGSARYSQLVLSILALQTILTEILFSTYW